MNALIRWVVYLYPQSWRARYEAEFLAMIAQYRVSAWDVLDTLLNVFVVRFSSNGGMMLSKTLQVSRRVLVVLFGLGAVGLWLVTQMTVPNMAQVDEIRGTFIDISVPCCDDVMITISTASGFEQGYVNSDLRKFFVTTQV